MTRLPVPRSNSVRSLAWAMRWDREDELDLTDIGGETGAATHEVSIAGPGHGRQSGGVAILRPNI
jgi:hypothetical protein